jgi:hypothetical protein
MSRTTLDTEQSAIKMRASLYVLLNSTHTPKTAEPIMPPMINKAPNADV